MTPELSEMLTTKLPLKFNADGKFKIMMMSDIQEKLNTDGRTFDAIGRLLDAEKPDLVILGGDNCDGHYITTNEELEQYVALVAKEFESRCIPWVQIWGNHDHDFKLDEDFHQSEYMKHPHNLSWSAKGITGQSNFVLPVLSSDGNSIAYNIWGLDSGPWSGRHASAKLTDLYRKAQLPNRIHPNQADWGLICFDQLMWYYNTSKQIEQELGRLVPGFLATHVPPYEICALFNNPEECGTVGIRPEHCDLSTFNSGLFAAIIQRGDIKTICSGHSHDNSECGTFCGIMMCHDSSVGYNCYGNSQTKGARVFELTENDLDNIVTRMVFSKDV